MPGARCARSLACKINKAHEHNHHGHTGYTRHSPRNGFNGFLRALPGDRAFLSPSLADVYSANLTPASRRQDHTTSPSASPRSRQQRSPRPPHPVPYVRDDRETPLQRERDVGSSRSDLGQAGTEISLQTGLDGPNHIDPKGDFSFVVFPRKRTSRQGHKGTVFIPNPTLRELIPRQSSGKRSHRDRHSLVVAI
jgi:hypothetical protein